MLGKNKYSINEWYKGNRSFGNLYGQYMLQKKFYYNIYQKSRLVDISQSENRVNKNLEIKIRPPSPPRSPWDKISETLDVKLQ